MNKLLLEKPNPTCAGIIPRAIVHVFEGKESDEDNDTVYDIRVSYIEIYNEEIRCIPELRNHKLGVESGKTLYWATSSVGDPIQIRIQINNFWSGSSNHD